MVELCAIFLNIVAAVEMGTRALCLHTNFVPSAATPTPISEIPAGPLATALTLLPYNVIIQYTSEPEEGQRPRSTRIACTGQSEWTMGRLCSLEATLKVTGSHYTSVPNHSPKKFPPCHPPNDAAQADCRRNKGSLQCNST